jgi:stalled ribosome rescue protein Dom34
MYRYRVKTQKTKSRYRVKLIPKTQDELWCLAFILHHTHKSWIDLVKQSLESSTIFSVIQKFQVHIDVQFRIWQGVVTMRKV